MSNGEGKRKDEWDWEFRFLFGLIKFIVISIPIVIKVFLRRRWARKSPNLLGVIVVTPLLVLVATGLNGVFALAFLFPIVAICRRIGSWWRSRKDEDYPSGDGEPWAIWELMGFQDTTTRRYIEPLFCIVIGLPLIAIEGLGAYIVVAGMMLFFQEQSELSEVKKMRAMQADARKEAAVITNAHRARKGPSAVTAVKVSRHRPQGKSREEHMQALQERLAARQAE